MRTKYWRTPETVAQFRKRRWYVAVPHAPMTYVASGSAGGIVMHFETWMKGSVAWVGGQPATPASQVAARRTTMTSVLALRLAGTHTGIPFPLSEPSICTGIAARHPTGSVATGSGRPAGTAVPFTSS